MSAPRKVRLTWRFSASEPLQTRVFASEAQANRFMRWQLPPGVVATLEQIEDMEAVRQTKLAPPGGVRRAASRTEAGSGKVEPKTLSPRIGNMRPAAPRPKAGVCGVCGLWRPANGRGHDICDIRIEEEGRGGRTARLPDGEPSPSWENVVRAFEDDE